MSHCPEYLRPTLASSAGEFFTETTITSCFISGYCMDAHHNVTCPLLVTPWIHQLHIFRTEPLSLINKLSSLLNDIYMCNFTHSSESAMTVAIGLALLSHLQLSLQPLLCLLSCSFTILISQHLLILWAQYPFFSVLTLASVHQHQLKRHFLSFNSSPLFLFHFIFLIQIISTFGLSSAFGSCWFL